MAGNKRGGINIVDKGRRQFQTISHEPGNKKGLSGNFITSVAESPAGTLFVATEENGLNVKEPGADYFTTYQYKPGDVNSISSNNVNNITIDHNGSIWLATYTDGICRFDPSTRKFKRYIAVNPKKNLENKVFNTLYEDRSGTLWASALRRGNHFGALYQYNRSADKFEIFDDRLSDLFSLLEDSQEISGEVVLPTSLKLTRIPGNTNIFTLASLSELLQTMVWEIFGWVQRRRPCIIRS
ncbi:hypothetical protein LWM68_19920 [Niabella sp. W65]|nr:hypothetical protein [Niabella sp. W65]MCH7364827.1 hypothetical protein [Niabella sp. W65]